MLLTLSRNIKDHAKNAEHKKYDKGIKIPAVVPVVLNMVSEGLDEETISRYSKIDIKKVLEIKEKYMS